MMITIANLTARVCELESSLLRLRQHVERLERENGVRRPGPVKITPEIVEDVNALAASGKGIREISRMLKISKTTVHKLVHGIYPETKRLKQAANPSRDIPAALGQGNK